MAKRWVDEGVIAPAGDDTYGIKRLDLGCGASQPIDGMPLMTRPFLAANDLGLIEPNVITIGYGLLKRYDSSQVAGLSPVTSRIG